MKDMNFKNFNYSFINSAKAGYKEVLVTYVANDKPVRKILFVKEAKGKGESYYVNEAKRQIDNQINSGKLAKESSKQIKHAGSKGILKPFMVTLSCVLAAGAIGAGGYFTYKYFTNPGGGGGGSYQPGDKVVTDVTVNDLPEGYSVTAADKATIGDDYNTDIYLNEKAISNKVAFEDYVLPDELTKVSYKIGDTVNEIGKENYTYTVDSASGARKAHLFISKEYVLGQIDLELTLKKVEAISLKVNFNNNSIEVFDKSGNKVEPGQAVIVKKNTIALTCKVLEKVKDQYKLTKDSFVVPSDPDATVDYNVSTGALSIYNVTKGGVLEIKEKSTDAILASVIPNHGSVIYEGVTYSEQQTFEVHPDSDKKVTFEIKLDENYILTKENSIGVIGGACFDPSGDGAFVQDPDDIQTYYITLEDVNGGFSMDFNPTELPESYLLLSGDSTRYGTFADTGAQYFDLKPFISKYDAKVMFKSKPGYETTQFAVKINDNVIENAQYVVDQGSGQNYMQLFFKEPIPESTKIIITLVEPTQNPQLILDFETGEDMTLIDNPQSKTPVSAISLSAAKTTGKSDVYFIFNEESEIDPTLWKYSINGLFGYQIDGVYDTEQETTSGDEIYGATLTVPTISSQWPGYDLELHAVPPVTATAVVVAQAYDESVVLRYQGKDVLCNEETSLTVYPNDVGDVEFELYSNVKERVIIEDNITIEGIARNNWEYDPKSPGTLYIHNVTQGQSFTIKKIDTCPATKEISVSVTKESMNSAQVWMLGKPPTQLDDTPRPFTFNVQEDFKFGVVGVNDAFTIESQCIATYTDDKGNQGTIYGRVWQNEAVFENAKITTYKSLVISPKVQAKEFGNGVAVSPGGTAYDWEKFKLNLNGGDDAYASPIKIYVNSKVDLEKDVEIKVIGKGDQKEYNFAIEAKPDGSDIFDYLIIINGTEQDFKTSGNSLIVEFNNPVI